MIWPIYICRSGGNIGRFNWVNSDTRRTCSSWVFWGDWWWDSVGERGRRPAMPDLSPAARAVLAAMHRSYDHESTRRAIATGILRVVADQVVPEAAEAVGDQHDEARHDQWLRIRWKILAIAAELEGQP